MLGNLNTSMSKEQKIENDKAGILKKCVGFFSSSLSNSAWLYQELIFPGFISRLSWQEKESIREAISDGIPQISSTCFFLPLFIFVEAIRDESSPE